MGWSAAKAQALKILGDGAEVPDLSSAIDKARADWDKAYDAFASSRDECQGKLLEMDNANSAYLNAIEQFRAKIEKNNFKIDSKKEAKKLQQAQRLLTGSLDEGARALQTNDKVLGELNKHLVQLGKYRQSSTPV